MKRPAKQADHPRTESTGPPKGEFLMPPEIEDRDDLAEALPQQEEFWRPPVRFGSVPVEKEPLGWDHRKGFRKLFPAVYLPFQVVERVAFGHPDLGPNRLFWGDNLHVMRQLPSESIDLIYIDPPFFSGRQYNVIFGDQNELRSFSDIWEGGMPGYLIWLNARLYEMKRLLKKAGSIYVHLDWHAVHYVKVEMDKIFGHESFRAEIIWEKIRVKKAQSRDFPKVHDTILCYSKTNSYHYSPFPAYVGVTHYRNAGGQPLPIGGSAESLFIQLLWHVVGADSEFTEGSDHKGPRAANVARALQRQRAGKTALRTRPGAP